MIVLFLCPIGVRKAQEAATATAMSQESGLVCVVVAIPMATGAAIRRFEG